MDSVLLVDGTIQVSSRRKPAMITMDGASQLSPPSPSPELSAAAAVGGRPLAAWRGEPHEDPEEEARIERILRDEGRDRRPSTIAREPGLKSRVLGDEERHERGGTTGGLLQGILPRIKAELKSQVFQLMSGRPPTAHDERADELVEGIKRLKDSPHGSLVCDLVASLLDYYGIKETLNVFKHEQYDDGRLPEEIVSRRYIVLSKEQLCGSLPLPPPVSSAPTDGPLLLDIINYTLEGRLQNGSWEASEGRPTTHTHPSGPRPAREIRQRQFPIKSAPLHDPAAPVAPMQLSAAAAVGGSPLAAGRVRGEPYHCQARAEARAAVRSGLAPAPQPVAPDRLRRLRWVTGSEGFLRPTVSSSSRLEGRYQVFQMMSRIPPTVDDERAEELDEGIKRLKESAHGLLVCDLLASFLDHYKMKETLNVFKHEAMLYVRYHITTTGMQCFPKCLYVHICLSAGGGAEAPSTLAPPKIRDKNSRECKVGEYYQSIYNIKLEVSGSTNVLATAGDVSAVGERTACHRSPSSSTTDEATPRTDVATSWDSPRSVGSRSLLDMQWTCCATVMGLGAPAVFRKMRGEEVQFEKQCTFIAMPWLKIGVPREGGTHCDVYNFPDNRPPTPSTRCRWPSAAQGSSRSDTCPARRPTPTPSTTSIRTCCSTGKP
ncbi:unnamed protein product [Vitrella brassicaformis CCMP3155]|uniref:LisH domain-containing protein n=1 Tax=Vitrella brassicaformis (strain CCMP3155) TaxID=1169540 RepID=A0A0G4EB09_VITBC|nr:unnamed protein product [Vitrella brassicaformis CCMP3155]|eukprot:CEL92863.1 unnamed protein product [Vitrella brassicaformis CCMP3155]